MPSLDASALLVVPVVLAGIVMLWLGPVVVAMALIRLVLYVQAGPLVAALRSWLGRIILPYSRGQRAARNRTNVR